MPRPELTGYIDWRTGFLVTFKGRPTGFAVVRPVAEYRNEEGDRSRAVILRNKRGEWAAGYALFDSGNLFRGERITRMERRRAEVDLQGLARSISEYWAERDAELDAEEEEE